MEVAFSCQWMRSMWFIKLFAVVACLIGLTGYAVVAADSKLAPQARIVGGTTTTIAAHPYAIQVYVSGRFICGASLVSDQFVLTAAHCTEGSTYNQFTVKGGATFLNNAGVSRTVKRVIRPKGYSSTTLDLDWSFLQLKTPMSGTNIAPIAFYTGTVPAGATVIVMGWGATSENGGTSNQLQMVQLQRVSRASCRSSFPNEQITLNMLCAKLANKDSCYGDSGGPLTYQGQLAGIVSWGYGCARTQPGVYTDVSYLASSLTSVMATYANK